MTLPMLPEVGACAGYHCSAGSGQSDTRDRMGMLFLCLAIAMANMLYFLGLFFWLRGRRSSDRAFVNRHAQHLGQMQRFAIRLLRNLFVATETVGDDERLLVRFPYCRQQDPLAAFDGHVVMITFLESKRAGHAAAA